MIEQVTGTSLQGYVYCTYSELTEALGLPTRTKGGGYKSDADWVVCSPDGKRVATVYNYKNGPNYLGKEFGIPVEHITEWHIGGHSQYALAIVAYRLGMLPVPAY